ncbi:hypothetical protein DD568_21310 [Klebsiella pneumoniae]|nr:hypothetical protein DD568_21310 [Klebsiella pneumoniae]
MSRVAKAPVVVPAGVDVKINGQVITIKGKNGELTRTLNDAVEVKHADNALTFGPRDGYADGWAQAGTARALLNSMVIGVTEGFTKKLQLVGVGYRAAVKGNVVNLALGFSHPVDHQLPAGITAECPTQTEIVLKGADKQVIGQVAADLRAYRRPEPYKGKGVRYAGIRRATRARRKLQELGATRLVVHRTPRHIYAQVIAPNGSEVLVAASTVEKAIAEQLKYTGNKDAAAAVGKAVAERALEKGIKDVSFDRSGFQYHGRVQALADAAREAGLQF